MNALYSLFGGSSGLVALLSNALGAPAELIVPSAREDVVRSVSLLPYRVVRYERGSDSGSSSRRAVSGFVCALAASEVPDAPRAGVDRLRVGSEVYRVERVEETRLADGCVVYRLTCERG